MPTTSGRSLGALSLLISLFCLFASAARADLVWSPNTGWRIEGGVLSEITGTDAHNALNLMNRARELEEDNRRGAAIKRYRRVAKKYPASIYASEALYRTGKLYLARRQYFKSFETFAELSTRYPNTKHFNDIIGEEYRIASALLDGARNRWWGWMPGFTNRSRAIDYFEVIIQTAPYSDYAPLALMNKARGHLRAKETEEAIDSLDRMINTYPQSLLAPDAYLKLAQTHALLVEGPNYDQGSTKEAITYFEDFLILFPNDPNVPVAAKGLDEMKQVLAESKIRIGDFYFKKRANYTAARVFYNEAITSYPDSAVAARARDKLVEVEAKAAERPGETPRKKRFFFF